MAEVRLRAVAPAYIGHCTAARRVQALIHRAVRTNVPVLLVGERGTGRSTIARVIHHFGGGEAPNVEVVRPDPSRPLLGLPGFTYLADLEDLPIEEQLRLPALVGNGRIVAATRLDPESAEGRRRLDAQIVRWLSGVRIEVPPLRDRAEDLELLAMELLRTTPSRHPVGGISDDALDCLRSYRWPGQLPELRKVIERALAVATGVQIELRDLPAKLRMRNAADKGAAAAADRRLRLDETEKAAIRRALGYTRGNRRRAAELLGIGKTTLYRKLREYGMD